MNNTDFDIVIFGSGFSCRYLVSKLTDCRKILILTSEKQSLNKYGINHKDGNSFIQHNIRISKDQLASSNAELVFLTKEICSKYERPVANWEEARKILDIPLKA